MRFNGRLKRVLSWIAIVAVVSISLMPAASQALAHLGSAPPAHDCEAHSLTVKHDELMPHDDAVTHAHEVEVSVAEVQAFDLCDYCSMHFTAAALPPLPAVVEASVKHAAELRCVAGAQPHAECVWANAQPRAPPAA